MVWILATRKWIGVVCFLTLDTLQCSWRSCRFPEGSSISGCASCSLTVSRCSVMQAAGRHLRIKWIYTCYSCTPFSAFYAHALQNPEALISLTSSWCVIDCLKAGWRGNAWNTVFDRLSPGPKKSWHEWGSKSNGQFVCIPKQDLFFISIVWFSGPLRLITLSAQLRAFKTNELLFYQVFIPFAISDDG